jgi:hypothetical protein
VGRLERSRERLRHLERDRCVHGPIVGTAAARQDAPVGEERDDSLACQLAPQRHLVLHHRDVILQRRKIQAPVLQRLIQEARHSLGQERRRFTAQDASTCRRKPHEKPNADLSLGVDSHPRSFQYLLPY